MSTDPHPAPQPAPAANPEASAVAPAPVGVGAWLVLIAAALASMMDGLDATALAVANPSIAADLHASLPALEAITTGYMLALAALVIMAGKLGDRYGHRRLFLTGLIVFAAASASVGLSTTTTEIGIWRIVQGIGGAILAANALALLRHSFPPYRFKIAVGLFSAGLALAALAGPFLGGALVQYVSWRAVFYLNLPLAAVAFVLAALHAPRRTRTTTGRLDLPGVGLLAAGVFALVHGVTRAGADGWSTTCPITALAATAALILGFVAVERSTADPVIPLDLFRSRRSRLGLIVILASGLTHFGTAYYFALYLQQLRGLSPLTAGASLLPMLGLVALGGPLSGLLNHCHGPRVPITAGLLLLTTGELGLYLIGLDAPILALVPWLLPMGLGVGLALPAATEVVISAAPEHHTGTAAGLQHTILMISGALAVTIYGAIITASAPHYAETATTHHNTGFLTGLGHALLLGAGLTLTAAIVTQAAAAPTRSTNRAVPSRRRRAAARRPG